MPGITADVAYVTADMSPELSDAVGFYGPGGSYAFSNKFRVGAENLLHDTDDFDGLGTPPKLDTVGLRVSDSL